MLKGDNGGVKPFHQFKQDVLKINDQYNKTYLNTEYNFVIASTQMAAKWAEFEQDGDEYYLQYRTAGDSSVRPEHAALDGITLPASDPFWDNYFPPNDWGCRCTAVQVLKNKYSLSNSAEAMATGNAATAKPAQKIFRFNPGTSQQIFPPKHPYFKNLPKDEKKELDKLLIKSQTKQIRQWAKENIDEKTGMSISGNNFASSSLFVNRASIRSVISKINSKEVRNTLFSLERYSSTYEYIGWKPSDAHHTDADFFTYYKVDINKKTFYVNVKASKESMREQLYCIYKKCDISALNKGLPPNINNYTKK